MLVRLEQTAEDIINPSLPYRLLSKNIIMSLIQLGSWIARFGQNDAERSEDSDSFHREQTQIWSASLVTPMPPTAIISALYSLVDSVP